jgi:hypothetical protein
MKRESRDLFKDGVYSGSDGGPYPQLTDADVRPGATRAGVDPNVGQPVVTIAFTPQGDRLFKRMSGNAARRGRRLGSLQNIAIVVDQHLYDLPWVDYNRFPNGINPTDGAEISNLASSTVADDLAVLLQGRPLPIDLVSVSERFLKGVTPRHIGLPAPPAPSFKPYSVKCVTSSFASTGTAMLPAISLGSGAVLTPDRDGINIEALVTGTPAEAASEADTFRSLIQSHRLKEGVVQIQNVMIDYPLRADEQSRVARATRRMTAVCG